MEELLCHCIVSSTLGFIQSHSDPDFNLLHFLTWGLPLSFISKEPACNAGDTGLIPGLGRSPGEGNGNPLQNSCLGNHMDRGTWDPLKPVTCRGQKNPIVSGVTKNQTQLSN